MLVGLPRVFASSDQNLRSRFALPSALASSPVLLAIKNPKQYDFDAVFAFQAVGSNSDKLTAWLQRNSLPLSLELNQETFQKIMNAAHRPLVVIVAVPSSSESHFAKIVEDASLAWRKESKASQRDVVFTWMDSLKWASWLKNMYGIQAGDEPSVIIADHQVSE